LNQRAIGLHFGIIFLGWILITLPSCTPAGQDPAGETGGEAHQAREAEEITALQGQWTMASNKGNLVAMKAFYAEDTVVVPPDAAPLAGINAIANWIDRRPADYSFELETSSLEIIVSGSWAFDRGTYALHAAPKDPTVLASEYGSYLRIWQKRDGSWKIARDIWNRLPEIGLAPDVKRLPKRP